MWCSLLEGSSKQKKSVNSNPRKYPSLLTGIAANANVYLDTEFVWEFKRGSVKTAVSRAICSRVSVKRR